MSISMFHVYNQSLNEFLLRLYLKKKTNFMYLIKNQVSWGNNAIVIIRVNIINVNFKRDYEESIKMALRVLRLNALSTLSQKSSKN